MSSELTLFSYEILGLVGREGAGPHDLRQMVRRGRMLDWAGESQYYAEPSGWPGSGTWRRARSRERPARAPSTRSPTRASRRCASTRHAGPLHAAEERAAAPPADRGPRRRGGDARQPARAARGHSRARGPATRREERAEALPHRRKYLLMSVRASCTACSTSTSSSWTRWSESSTRERQLPRVDAPLGICIESSRTSHSRRGGGWDSGRGTCHGWCVRRRRPSAFHRSPTAIPPRAGRITRPRASSTRSTSSS